MKIPHPLLDTTIQYLNLKNDAALSRALELSPVIISKIRNRKIEVSPSVIITIHEATNEMPIRTIRELIAAAGPLQQVAA